MHDLLTILFGHLTDLNLYSFYVALFNNVLPFGMFFWLTGFALFIVILMKTDNYAYAGAFLALYMMIVPELGFITNIWSSMAMQYSGLLIGLIVGFYLYLIFRGS